jgi:hypothetical protein
MNTKDKKDIEKKRKADVVSLALKMTKDAARKGASNYSIAKGTEISEKTIGNYVNGNTSPNYKLAQTLIQYFNSIQQSDVAEHENESDSEKSIKFYPPENAPTGKRLIPLYDDISSIGGKINRHAKMEAESQVSEWIDPGDWFRSATAAIRHDEDSMVEYPSGCILALKEVRDRMLIVPGKDYVVETNEYRVTKKIQFADEKGYICLHSTNTDRYEDGTLIHQSFNLSLERDVTRMFEVLGYVVKKSGGTIVYNNQNK